MFTGILMVVPALQFIRSGALMSRVTVGSTAKTENNQSKKKKKGFLLFYCSVDQASGEGITAHLLCYHQLLLT